MDSRIYLVILFFCLLTFETLQVVVSSSAEPFIDFYDFKKQFLAADSTMKSQLLSSYITWQTSKGFPAIINDTSMVFIYYGSATTVSIAGDFNSWDPSVDTMIRLDPNYDLFYHAYTFEKTARLDYKFVVDNQWILDPRNSHQISGGYGPNSELAMPGFVQPTDIIKQPDIPHGTVMPVTTSFTGPNPKVQVYLPPGYNSSDKYMTIYFTDGSEYINLGSAVNILNNLINASKIDPMIAVFIDPYGSRNAWYNCSDIRYATYMDNIVSYMDANFATIPARDGRAHIGDSLGGQITAFIGLQRPQLFKYLGVHSGAFWDGGGIGCGIKDQIKNASASLDLAWWLTAGSYETTIYQDTKTVVTYLQQKGWEYNVSYYFEGHSWGQWRHTLSNFLQFLPRLQDTTTSLGSLQSTTTNSATNTTKLANNSTKVDTSTTKSKADLHALGSLIAALMVNPIIKFKKRFRSYSVA